MSRIEQPKRLAGVKIPKGVRQGAVADPPVAGGPD